MTTERDFDRIADAWLADGPIELSDHALRSAITQVRVTRQRRVGRWVWAGQARMAAAGVAILGVVAAVAILAVAIRHDAPAQVASTSPSPGAVIPADRGVFTPTGSMLLAREMPSATLLLDGRVLVIGGYGGETSGEGSYPGGTGPLASAEVWDPATGLFAPAGTMREARQGPSATLLRDGRVLVVGRGSEEDPPSAEIWDPSTTSFGPTGSPSEWRSRSTATLLTDGRVLISGGWDPNGAELRSAEVWDPDTGTFGRVDSLPEAGYPVGTVLDDGRVLVLTEIETTDANGVRNHGRWSAAVWDPATSLSSPAGSLTFARGGQFTTTRLLDGRVLITGGDGCLKRGACIPITAAEIWDPSTLSSSSTGPLVVPRAEHAATLLLDGRVLIVGDLLGGGGNTAEVFELR